MTAQPNEEVVYDVPTVPGDTLVLVMVKGDGTVDRYVNTAITTEEYIRALRELADNEEADLEASK